MRTIAIGFVVFTLAHGGAAAQSAAEQAQIIRDFQMSVADYTQLDQCAGTTPAARTAAMPAPRIFTVPVAMVFRQLIARTLAERDGVAAISGVGAYPHPAALEPFPSIWLQAFPRVLQDALPPLPAPLEYRLIGHDLVLRDNEADIVVGVVRDAVGPKLTVIR